LKTLDNQYFFKKIALLLSNENNMLRANPLKLLANLIYLRTIRNESLKSLFSLDIILLIRILSNDFNGVASCVQADSSWSSDLSSASVTNQTRFGLGQRPTLFEN